MATFAVIEKQGLKMIKATINGETIRAEAGALHYMLGDIVLESKMPSAKGFLKSIVTQESVFKPTYTGTGEVFFWASDIRRIPYSTDAGGRMDPRQRCLCLFRR